MRSYKLTLAALFILAPAVLGLAACTGAEPETPEPPEAAQAKTVAAQPRAKPVTPAADMSAASATRASQAAQSSEAPAAEGDAPAPPPFPGEADLLPTLNAVAGFCARPGSLAFMTGDGCKAALAELSRSVTPNLHFASMDECLGFLRKIRAERGNITAAHTEWCKRSFVNLHDRKGCYDAAPVFLDSLTDEGFCRKAPPPVKKPDKPKDTQAPYIYGYKEPGQKFDSPKSGPMPGSVKAKPAPAKKGAAPKPSAPEAKARAAAPKAEVPDAPEAPAAVPAAADAATEPAPQAAPGILAGAEPAGRPAAASAPVSPAPAASAPSRPAETDLGAATSQSISATTGPNAVSPAAVPAGVLATSGGQVEAANTLPPQGAQPGTAPVLPAPEVEQNRDLPEPNIGRREEVTPLPPVPPIGRIAPQLMPGVPSDTAVMDNTLPAPDDAPVPPPATAPSGQVTDAFSEVIPNVMPPPPPNPQGAATEALPLSGAPAGQSGE